MYLAKVYVNFRLQLYVVRLPFVKHQKKTAGPDRTKIPKDVWGIAFLKQAIALSVLVLIPVTNELGFLISEYQLPDFIRRSYPEPICNVFTQREMQYYIFSL